MRNIDIPAAVELYYSSFVIRPADIRRIFGCGHDLASRLMRQAAEYTIAQGQALPSMREVSVRTAYEAWGYDIADLEERARKLARVRK